MRSNSSDKSVPCTFFSLFVVMFVACASVLFSRVHFPCTQVSFSQVRNKKLGRAILPDCKPSIGHLVLRRKEMLAGPLSRSVSFGPSRGSFDFSLSGSNFVQANSLHQNKFLVDFRAEFLSSGSSQQSCPRRSMINITRPTAFFGTRARKLDLEECLREQSARGCCVDE